MDVATDPGFSERLSPEPFETEETSLQLEGLAPVTYHWRLWTDATAAGAWSEASFDVLGDAVHVYCPAPGPCG